MKARHIIRFTVFLNWPQLKLKLTFLNRRLSLNVAAFRLSTAAVFRLQALQAHAKHRLLGPKTWTSSLPSACVSVLTSQQFLFKSKST